MFLWTDPAEDGATDPKRQCTQVGVMTTEQIRNMMANTMKELNERKKALANIKGIQDPATAFAAKQFEPPPKVPLPPPKVVTIETVTDKTKTIAALQAQIANRWNFFFY